MRALFSIRRRPFAVLGLLLFLATASGCGDDPTRDLPERTIYFSVPLSGPLAQRGRDLADGALLALDQTNYDTPDVRIKLRVLDAKNEARNLSAARADRGALAYVTNREIPAMPASMPGGRLLQITLAPATDPLSAITSEVIHLLPSATYAGMALAQAVANGDPPAVSLRCGDTAFDRAARAGFQHAMRNAPTPIALTLDSARDHAAPPFGCSAKGPNAGGTYLLDDINQSDPTSAAGLVTPAMASRDYPHSGKRFAKAFKDFHAREPDRFAIYGYEAAGLALNAITDAGETGDAVTRVATLKAALALRNRFGPVGHYDVLPNGQTTLYMFGIRSWPPDIKAEEEESRTIEVDRG